MRLLRVLLLVVVSFVVSGAPQVFASALDDDCCTTACEGALDGRHCPPNCDQALCARVHASIVVAELPSVVPTSTIARALVLSQTSPHLPIVTAGVFHPPRA